MGLSCSKNEEVNTNRPKMHVKGGGGGGNERKLFASEAVIPQVLMLGPSGSGKTTLLYKSLIPSWSDITSQMVETHGFHYEELQLSGSPPLGIWEVAGEFCDLWPSFYRYVKMTAVIFVISLADASDEVVQLSRRWLRMLFNEEELRMSKFLLVMNTFDLNEESLVGVDDLLSRLGLTSKDLPLRDTPRLKHFVVNAKEALHDPQWLEAVTFIMAGVTGRR